MSLSATVYTKPGCGPCTAVKKMLELYGVPYAERDVTADAAAERTLRDIYATRLPGKHPSTPVTLLTTSEGTLTIFGADIRGPLRAALSATAA